MQIEPLAIAGAWVISPRQFPDPRGAFMEGFRADHLEAVVGHRLQVQQTNVSVSVRGAVRGIHYADVPPSQAKYVTATSGVFWDYIIDLRVGSPTFAQWDRVVLDDIDRRAVYLSEGLGHALVCLQDGVAMYLCSEVYAPDREHAVNPLDPDIALEFPEGLPLLLSEKDTGAPTLAEAQQAGALPTLTAATALAQDLATRFGSTHE